MEIEINNSENNNINEFEEKNSNVKLFTINDSDSLLYTNMTTYIQFDIYMKFINDNNCFQSDKIYFYSPINQIKIFYKIILIPNKLNLTINIIFFDDEKNNEINDLSNHNININLSIFSMKRKTYWNSVDKVFRMNENKNSNNVTIENYIIKNKRLVEEDCLKPLIIKIRVYQKLEPKKIDNYIGLINEGNTCYFNSIIQIIYHIPYVRNKFFNISIKNNNNELNKIDSEIFLFYFQKILYKLNTLKEPFSISEQIKNTLYYKKNTNFLDFIYKNFPYQSQQDAQEVFMFIIDYFSNIDNNNNKEKLKDFFDGIIKYKIEINDNINYKSFIEDEFLFLSLDIDDKTDSLEKCIEKFFQGEELKGDNAYFCDKDNRKHSALKTLKFKKGPDILFFHLKRFGANNKKIYNKISYPEQMELTKYFDLNDNNSDDEDININDINKDKNYYYNNQNKKKYTLFSIIVHEGQINSGHYYSYIYNFDKKNFYKFNDSSVSKVINKVEIFEDNFGGTKDIIEFEYNNNNKINIKKSISKITRTAYLLGYIEQKCIKKYFNYNIKLNVNKELEEKFNKIPNQTIITDFFDKNNNNNNYYNKNDYYNKNQRMITRSSYARNEREEKEMIDIAIINSMNENGNKNNYNNNYNNYNNKYYNNYNNNYYTYSKKNNFLNESFSKKLNNVNSNLNSNKKKENSNIKNFLFVDLYINQMDLKKQGNFKIEINKSAIKKTTPKDFCEFLLNNSEFKEKFQNSINNFKLIILNQFGLFYQTFELNDVHQNLSKEIFFSSENKQNNKILLYLFTKEINMKNEEFFIIQNYYVKEKNFSLPYFTNNIDDLFEYKENFTKNGNYFQIVSDLNMIEKSQNFDEIKIKPFEEKYNYSKNKKCYRLIYKIL